MLSVSNKFYKLMNNFINTSILKVEFFSNEVVLFDVYYASS